MSSDKPDLKIVPAPQAAGATPPGPPTLPPVPKGVPPWAYVILVALFVVAALLGRQIAPPVEPKPAEPQYVPVIVPMQPSGPQVSQGTAPLVVEGDRQGPARRLLARLVRHRLSEQLQRDGFALVGGNPKALTKAEASQLLANLDDDTLIAGTQVSGGLGDGKILDTLGKILDWIIANQDKILAVVKFFLTILMVFADGGVG
jgi:hypothetical protein